MRGVANGVEAWPIGLETAPAGPHPAGYAPAIRRAPSWRDTGGLALLYFAFQAAMIVIGMIIHILVDKVPARRTRPRVIELATIWTLAGTGAWSILAGILHLGPMSDSLAEEIGYTQSMFQWEVGWADIAIGVLGVGTIWKRDGWLDAAVAVLTICYLGDAIGHIMEYVAHDNTASANVGAIPTDILQPVIAIVLLVLYRAEERKGSPAAVASPV